MSYTWPVKTPDSFNPSAPLALAASWRPTGCCLYCSPSHHCWLSATLLVIRASDHTRLTDTKSSFTTSGLWWTIPTWSITSGLCSRWPKVPSSQDYKCSWGMRWTPLRMKCGHEKELTDTFLFFPHLDGQFCSLVGPPDLSGRSSHIFLWSSGQLGNIPHSVFSLLHFPFFIQPCCSGILTSH